MYEHETDVTISIRMCQHKKSQGILQNRTFTNLKIQKSKPDDQGVSSYFRVKNTRVSNEVERSASSERSKNVNKDGKFNTAYKLGQMLRRNDLIKNHYPIRNSCRGASLESERDNEDAVDGVAKSAKNMTNQVYCRISRKTTESVQP